jgi:hypothetical protein
MPVVKKCAVCGAEFKTKPFFIKNGGGKYCSATCHHSGLRSGSLKKCFVCGTETYKKAVQIERSKSGKFFCDKSCQAKWRNQEFVGVRHANWKNGLFAYRSVLARNKIIQICTLCGSKDKRILAVHHIDKDRTNNKLTNLVYLCHNCHFLVHHDIKERQKFMTKIGSR